MSRALLFVRGFSLFQTYHPAPSSEEEEEKKETIHSYFGLTLPLATIKKKYYPFTYYIISLFPKTNQHTTYNQPTNQPCIFCNNTLVSHSLLIVFLFIILFNSSSRESPSSSYVFFFLTFFYICMYIYLGMFFLYLYPFFALSLNDAWRFFFFFFAFLEII